MFKVNIKKILFLGIALVTILGIILLNYSSKNRSGFALDSKLTNGDYVIVFNPNVRADTFLLDKKTGKIWRLTQYSDLDGEPVAWQYMERIDDTKGFVDFLSWNSFKKKNR